MAGVGGIINDRGGHIILIFSWGLGTMTNNEEEYFYLHECIIEALLKGIQRIIICGLSLILIRDIIKQNIAGRNMYKCVLARIQDLLRQFKNCAMFRIKQEMKMVENQLDKKGSTLWKGEMKVNRGMKPHPIP